MTLGAIMAAHERGVALPDEVDFIGYDNVDLCSIVSPKLEIVEQPMDEMGLRAAELLLALIPARELGCENEIGSIAPGKRADFVVCDEEVNRKTVFLCGKPLKNGVAENNKGRNLNTEIQRGGI